MAAGKKAASGSENFPNYGSPQFFYLWQLSTGFKKQMKNTGNPQAE